MPKFLQLGFRLFTSIALLLLFYSHAVSQDQFTKIVVGAPATDGGTSFGMAWIDYDNDDNLDLFVSNFPVYNMSVPIKNYLYHNNGDGTFTKITGDQLTEYNALTWVGTWADYDNDGYIDMYAVNGYNHDNQLYHNNGDGAFTRITTGQIVTEGISSNGGNWIDYDRDGLVDIFTANDGYGGPTSERSNRIYKNNDSGNFNFEIAGELMVQQVTSHSAEWCDYDNDGDDDVFIANYNNVSNQLLQNNGDGTFSNLTVGQMTSDGIYSTGANWADVDNDGDFDLFVINYRNLANFFYENNGDGTFLRRTDLTITENSGSSLSSCFGDYDNDGDLDLVVTNSDFYTSTNDHNNLYENNGDGTFTKITTGIIVTDPGKSCGGAWGDYDRDGDLDLYVARYNSSQANGFYQNNGNSNNWLEIKCEGYFSNKSAIGTKVKVKSTINGQPVWQLRQIESQSGYANQNLILHYGLGDAGTIDSIIVEWPSGSIEYFTDILPNQYLKITENCCINIRGNVDSDSEDLIDISDLVYLVDFMFTNGPSPTCLKEANIDGDIDENIDISDLVYLVDFMFTNGDNPADCL